jgi:phage shock protein E
MSWLSSIFSSAPKIDYSDIIKNGGQIIDVRSKAEFQSGHIKGAVNIPLDQLSRQMNKINKEKPVITCCASGMRSGSAKNILRAHGYEVYNGGGWTALQKAIS